MAETTSRIELLTRGKQTRHTEGKSTLPYCQQPPADKLAGSIRRRIGWVTSLYKSVPSFRSPGPSLLPVWLSLGSERRDRRYSGKPCLALLFDGRPGRFLTAPSPLVVSHINPPDLI